MLAVLPAVAVLAAPAAGSTTSVLAGGATSTATASLLLDRASFRPELAMSSEQRSLGLMHRKKAPRDGMLFVFPNDTSGGFWMKNTLVPLRIVFYDVHGVRVRTLSMKPCRRDPCRLYDPGRRYRFALELAATDTRPARRLGPTAQLYRLTSRAR